MSSCHQKQNYFFVKTHIIHALAETTSKAYLIHRDRVTHICVSKLTIIGSHNGLSPCRRQAIMWTSAGMLLVGPLGTNFSEIFIEIHTFSFKKMYLKMSSAKWCPFCLGISVIITVDFDNGILFLSYAVFCFIGNFISLYDDGRNQRLRNNGRDVRRTSHEQPVAQCIFRIPQCINL